MATHKERLETLEIHVNNIQEGLTKMLAKLHRLSESLNSRGESWQGSLSQNRINNHSPPSIKGKLQLGEKRGKERSERDGVDQAHKILATSVIKCGRGKVWLDPNEVNESP